MLLEGAGKGYCHALIPEPRPKPFYRAFIEAQFVGENSEEPVIQGKEIGGWGEGGVSWTDYSRSNSPPPFPQYKPLYPPYSPES